MGTWRWKNLCFKSFYFYLMQFFLPNLVNVILRKYLVGAKNGFFLRIFLSLKTTQKKEKKKNFRCMSICLCKVYQDDFRDSHEDLVILIKVVQVSFINKAFDILYASFAEILITCGQRLNYLFFNSIEKLRM